MSGVTELRIFIAAVCLLFVYIAAVVMIPTVRMTSGATLILGLMAAILGIILYQRIKESNKTQQR